MDVIRHAGEIRAACAAVRAGGRSLGFVPTMGFFHEGHLSLMRTARLERDHVVASIFVNPLQFGPAEDFASYPRDLDRDLALAEKEGVDVAFVPDVDEMYPNGRPAVTVDPGPLADVLEGTSRPGHFRGVCTVLARLFHLVGPSRAYFGEKDAQQVAVVRLMVRDLAFPIEVRACPTVRESDGLAMSSRNTYLPPADRERATVLYRSLVAARDAVAGGEQDARSVLVAMGSPFRTVDGVQHEYAAIVDEETFEEVQEITSPARALVAAQVGPTRLIDNMALPVRQN